MPVAIAGTVSEVEVANNSTATTVTVPTPAGAAVGEMLVAVIAHNGSTAPGAVSGWTIAASRDSSGSPTASQTVYYRVLSAAPAASYTFTIATGRATAVMYRLSGADTTTPLGVAPTTDATAAATSFTFASATTAVNDVLTVATITQNAPNTHTYTFPAEMTKVVDPPGTGDGKAFALATEFRPTVGAIGTRVVSSTTSSAWTGIRVHWRSAVTTSPGQIIAYAGNGTFADSLGGPTLTGNGGIGFAPSTIPNRPGQVFSLDGINDYAQASGVLTPATNRVSVRARITRDASITSGWRAVVTKLSSNTAIDYALEYRPDDRKVQFLATVGSVKVLTTWIGDLSNDQMHTLVGTYDGTAIRLYVDGTERAATAATGTLLTSTAPLRIGSWDGVSEFHGGTVGDVAVWNRALPPSEISSDHQQGVFSAVSANLTGVGSLSVTSSQTQGALVRPVFAGAGNLTATRVSQGSGAAVLFTGSGQLVNTSVASSKANVSLGGSGQLAVTVADIGMQVSLTGAGSLDLTSAINAQAVWAMFGASGTLLADSRPGVIESVTLDGSGDLSPVLRVGAVGVARIGATGTLTPVIPLLRDLTVRALAYRERRAVVTYRE